MIVDCDHHREQKFSIGSGATGLSAPAIFKRHKRKTKRRTAGAIPIIVFVTMSRHGVVPANAMSR